MSVKVKIRTVRVEQGISQEALAELLEVSRQTVSKWENGQVRPSAENLARLSQVFGVPVDALLKDDWVPPEEKPPEIRVVEVPVPRTRNYRLWALLAAVVLAAGILVGALFFRERPEESVSESTLEGEVIDRSQLGGGISFLPVDE